MSDMPDRLRKDLRPGRVQSDYQNPGNDREADDAWYDKGDNQRSSGGVSYFGTSDGSNNDTERGRRQVRDKGHTKPTL